MFNLIIKLIIATVVAIVFGIIEILWAIPCALKDYYKTCVRPAFKEIFNDYRNKK